MFDLCTGNGVIPLLLLRERKGILPGLEIQKRLVKYGKQKRTIK